MKKLSVWKPNKISTQFYPRTFISYEEVYKDMYISSSDGENRAVITVGELMLAAIRTAPKAKGVDNIVAGILTGDDKMKLVDEMKRIGEVHDNNTFRRDALCVERAHAIVLIGTRFSPVEVRLCGLCGFVDCNENKKNNGTCVFNLTDLGIAIGSAVSIAAEHRIDNRIMYTAGMACTNLGLLGDDVRLCFGIPLSISGKNIFFDRKF
jgi:uncharacterized ferredoxin-like protein